MKRFGLMASLALILLVNAIVIAGVSYNRSGEPDAVVMLTERELHLQKDIKESSGVSLQIALHSDYDRWSEPSPWFDRKKLEEIGFDCTSPIDAKEASRRYDRMLPRRTYVVLELEGKSWENWQAREEEKIKELEAQVVSGQEKQKKLDDKLKHHRWKLDSGSRLFTIDVGNDAAALRKRYPDRTKYIITSARVRLRLIPRDEKTGRKAVLSGYVDLILTNAIHVPLDRQGVLGALKSDVRYFYYDAQKEPFTPRYRVRLNYGRRYEPWLAEVVSK